MRLLITSWLHVAKRPVFVRLTGRFILRSSICMALANAIPPKIQKHRVHPGEDKVLLLSKAMGPATPNGYASPYRGGRQTASRKRALLPAHRGNSQRGYFLPNRLEKKLPTDEKKLLIFSPMADTVSLAAFAYCTVSARVTSLLCRAFTSSFSSRRQRVSSCSTWLSEITTLYCSAIFRISVRTSSSDMFWV